MTPIALLTKSHTIQGALDRPSPYRFAKGPLPRLKERSTHSEPAFRKEPEQSSLFVPAKPDPEPAPAPQPIEESKPKIELAPPESAKKETKAGVWRLLLNRMLRKRRVDMGKSVQTELALERVSVIRNDLSDYDLEVRPKVVQKKAGEEKDAAFTR